MRKAKLIIFCLILGGCSNYVSKIHKQLDQDLGARQGSYRKNRDSISFYRKGAEPRRKSKLTSRSLKNVAPSVKRYYKAPVKKRYTAADLVDNESAGSLWSEKGQSNFLFSKNKIIKNGDIIVIQVEKTLKKEITLELQKTFPSKRKPAKKETPKAAASATAPGGAKKDKKEAHEVFDKISSVVVEEINKDYLLLRGRKDVLYKKAKRLIEVEVLVARKDITDEDTVLSSTTLEKNVNVLR